MKMCPSRFSHDDRRHKCELAFGHTGWHLTHLPDGSEAQWDGRGQFKVEVSFVLRDDEDAASST